MVTGHTGFKGSWLVAWLQSLGAKVSGVALDPVTSPNHFDAIGLYDRMERDLRFNIHDGDKVNQAIREIQPDFVFHLAAQALVRKSYQDPVETWQTNLMGTLNVLEGLRQLEKPCAAVFITSDKCYDNVEWEWGYRENDRLGGPDPYSASKGGAELVIKSHIKSFFQAESSPVRIASARAGNVIGGGDWSEDRIIPDCIRAWASGEAVELRSPQATRPWQHVLEPLSGYLTLAAGLKENPGLHGEPFNFGPPARQNHSVLELVQEMSEHWDQVRWEDVSDTVDGPHESGLLKLNCDKALHHLKWAATLGFEETVEFTSEWYSAYYADPSAIADVTARQIERYFELFRKRN